MRGGKACGLRRLVRRPSVRSDGGFHLVELSMAVGVLAIAVISLAGALGLGIRAIGQAKQRSEANALVTERIERIRNLPYEQVALDVEPTHVDDPDDPDYYVTTEDPPRYDVHQDGSLYEPFVVGGSVLHIEDPVFVGDTELYAYQYVTWVDDANIDGTQDYKRVTVVVSWKFPVNRGSTSTVQASTFVGERGVTVPQVTPAPASPSPTPTPTASPEGTATCDGDETAPTGSVDVLSGAGAEPGYSSSTSVQVRLTGSDDCDDLTGELSNDGTSFSHVTTFSKDAEGNWLPSTVSWEVPSGDGSKTVYARIVDGAGNVSTTYTDDVVLDETPPTAPGNLSESSCGISDNDRTVTLTWDASSDANLSGYRLYRSIDSESYEVVETTAQLSASDTSKKTHDSVRYKVRAFDKAGNESGDSNVLTYTKNSC